MNESVTVWTGAVTHLATAPAASAPMCLMPSLNLIEGIGIDGDRYASGKGFYSDLPEPGRQITLFEMETLEALKRDHGIDLGPEEHRRNVTVRGVPLNHLVGRRFWLGAALLEGTRLSTPCKHVEDVTGKVISRWLIHRSGLNCIILKGGVVHSGDIVRPV